MTRNIKGMITMKTSKLLAIAGACLALALAGCATHGRHQDGQGAAARRRGQAAARPSPSARRSARQAPSRSSRRRRSATSAPTQRADFEKAMKRYAGGPEGRRPLAAPSARSVSDAFKRVADDNPGLVEARFNQGAVLYECGREDEAARIWEGLQVRPGDHQPRLHRLEEQRARPGRVAVQAAIDDDPLHSVEARNNLAQILRDKARQAVEQRREEELRRPGGQQPAHRARARQQQPAGVLDAGVHLLRHEHAGDGQAGRQPGHQEGRRDRDRQVRGGEGRGGRRGQGRARAARARAKKERARRSGDEDEARQAEGDRRARPAPASPAT